MASKQFNTSKETEHTNTTACGLDIKMPLKDGFEVLKQVRENPKLSRMPVIIFSSSNQERDVNRAYDLGANSYVVKPSGTTGLDEFVKKIHDYSVNVNEQPTHP